MKRKRLIAMMIAGSISISVIFAGCGSNSIDAKATGATFNKEEISLGFLNFIAKYQQAVYDGNYLSMFGDEMWTQDLYGDGSSFQESVKKEIVTDLENMLVLEANMSDYNVEISDEEQKKIEEVSKQFINDNSDKAIRQIGATEEYIKRMLTLQTIKAKMYQKIIANVDQNVSDEEAAQRTFSYVQINKNTKTGEDGTTVNYTDEEKKDLEKNAEAFAKEAKEDFNKAAEDHGYTVSTHSYGKDEETFEKTVIEAADKLKEGDITGLLSTDTDYYVVRLDKELDEEATLQKKESIRSQRESDQYTKVLDELKEKAIFKLEEEEWEKIKFNKLFSIKAVEENPADAPADEQTGNEEQDSATAGEGQEE